MAGKANFAPDDWARVVASPMVITMAITAADPSGLWGMLKESMSSGWSLLEVKKDASANPLAKAVADDITGFDDQISGARAHAGAVQGRPGRGDQDKGDRRASSCGEPVGREGARRSARLQGVAAAGRTEGGRSWRRGRISRLRGRGGQRRGESDPGRYLQSLGASNRELARTCFLKPRSSAARDDPGGARHDPNV